MTAWSGSRFARSGQQKNGRLPAYILSARELLISIPEIFSCPCARKRTGEEGMAFRFVLTTTLLAVIIGFLTMPKAVLAQDDQLMIAAIEIRGNEYITDQEILSVMEGRAGDVFSLNTLSDDLARIEDLGWFSSEPAHILEPFDSGVKIIILVVENPMFVGVQITQQGPGLFPPAELALLFDLPEDQVMNNHDKSTWDPCYL